MRILILVFVALVVSSASAQCPSFDSSHHNDGFNGLWFGAPIQLDDLNFVVASLAYDSIANDFQATLTKSDVNGDTVWYRSFGGTNPEGFNCVAQTGNGGFVAAGITWSYGNGLSDWYVVRVDANGQNPSSHTYGGGLRDMAYDAARTPDGGVVIIGFRDSNFEGYHYPDPSKKIVLMKLNAEGDTSWTRTFDALGDTTFRNELLLAVAPNGSIVAKVVVEAQANTTYQDWIWRLDESGESTVKLVLTSDSQWGEVREIVALESNEIAMYQSGQIVYYSNTLDSLHGRTISINAGVSFVPRAGYHNDIVLLSHISQSGTTYPWLGFLDADGNFVESCILPMEGYFLGWHGSDHRFYFLCFSGANENTIFRSDPFLDATFVEPLIPDNLSLLTYPNPFNATTTISFELPRNGVASLRVYDVLGKEVATLFDGQLPAGDHQFSWDASSFATGIYFVRLASPAGNTTQKLVLLK
ncbi:MAG: T9SS type A sorting domain-containing protein [Calditrichaeota bacterium]|nr:T9SS type A sorting domain-containing protein [Calditrichota bacterium]